MKILFLGTSNGSPQKGRNCQSILFETDAGNAYIVDAGAPVLDQLYKYNYSYFARPSEGAPGTFDNTVGGNIKAIFITHLHRDHIVGLPFMHDLEKCIGMNFTTYLPEERGVKALTDYVNFQGWDQIGFCADIRAYEGGTFYDNGDIKVTAFHSEHLKRSTNVSYGFLIEADGQKVYVTGDLDSDCDIPEFLYDEKVDLIISECAHFEPEVAIDKIEKCKTARTAFIHVFPPHYEGLKRLKEEKKLNVIFPDDGDWIEI